MARYSWIFLATLWAAGTASAASWADALFNDLNKDFGSVARGPVLTHPFLITNSTGGPVHIAGIHASCGCVTATARKQALQTNERTIIAVEMDTKRFLGEKNVTIFVQLDQPHFEEVRLTVRANSRDDVAVSPAALDFGHVAHSGGAAIQVTVALSGNADWQITEATSESKYVQTDLKEQSREAGRVIYGLTAKLRPGLPPGNWYNEIWLKTTNPDSPMVRVPVAVVVEAPLSASPASVALGSVKPGGQVEGKVIIRGPQPFHITAVAGADGTWKVRDTTPDGQAVHVLAVTLLCTKAGPVQRSFRVQTDLKEEGAVGFTAQAQVAP
jgi:hypothetical protein